MIAAIYARKSTVQHVADDAKSVALQVANAKAFAIAKGWEVKEELIFTDDGISGAESDRLRQRACMIAAAARGQFDVVVMRAQDRFSRREGAEAIVELKNLAKHVGVWFYAEGKPFEYGGLGPNTLAFLKAEFAAEERRNASKRTHEKMRDRAEKGYVTGGRVFGYDRVRRHGYVERIVNPKEAAVVQDIFERYANGEGLKAIAYALNAQHLASPRCPEGPSLGLGPRHRACHRAAADLPSNGYLGQNQEARR